MAASETRLVWHLHCRGEQIEVTVTGVREPNPGFVASIHRNGQFHRSRFFRSTSSAEGCAARWMRNMRSNGWTLEPT